MVAAKRRGTEARRRRLAAVAGRLIRERGFEGLSVNDLAAGAGISVGGMYRYIRTKSDLLGMVCEDIYGDLRERIAAVAGGEGPLPERLRAAMRVYLEACAANRGLILLMYREYRHLQPAAQRRYQEREQAIADLFAGLLRAGMRAGAFRAADAETIACDIVFLGHLPALKGWALRGRIAPGRLAEEQIALVFARLG